MSFLTDSLREPSAKADKPPVVFLLAVWGKSYIEQFFDFSLRSLLAPGNIPALNQEFECTFLFLTTRADIPFFEAQPIFNQLKAYCKIDFVEISDLIFSGNYSATLTLAYERGMRSRGGAMCDTYFFFLVSDYIMSNGSLRNMGRYLKAGYSGITTGNFLVVEEYISQIIKEIMVANDGLFALNSREMLALAFPFLHPVSLGHTVTQSFTHATHANRLFWKVNDKVIVGRFYLRHMLCIRPETDNYRIGASCDYSFIAEMCPSGNVVHIQDSDDYCVIEMAPFDYEKQWIQAGGFEIQSLADHMSNWTTHVHRANAHIPIIFHSEALNEPSHATLQMSADFIQEIEKRLSQQPQPIRGHYYWTSCVESIFSWILLQTNRSCYLNNGVFAGILGSPTFSPIFEDFSTDHYLLKLSRSFVAVSLSKKQKRKALLKKMLNGDSPQTSFWHLHWFDDYLMKNHIKEKLAQNGPCIVIAFEPISEIVDWLEREFPHSCVYQFYELFMARSSSDLNALFQNKKHVIIHLSDDRFCELGAVIRQCTKYLPTGGEISVCLKHKKVYKNEYFKQSVAVCLADLQNTQVFCEKVQIHSNISRIYFQRQQTSYDKKLFAPKKNLCKRLLGFVGLSAVCILCTAANLLAFLGVSSKKKSTSATLFFKCKRM